MCPVFEIHSRVSKKELTVFLCNQLILSSYPSIRLDKAAIGDFIGDVEPFNIKVMHAFIDSLSFTSVDFVPALRLLLQTFRLPGEAQKIDRIMEKFADRYCENNPGIFAHADTAYTLAYSVIMLNTDQHSSKIRHRMDKAVRFVVECIVIIVFHTLTFCGV